MNCIYVNRSGLNVSERQSLGTPTTSVSDRNKLTHSTRNFSVLSILLEQQRQPHDTSSVSKSSHELQVQHPNKLNLTTKSENSIEKKSDSLSPQTEPTTPSKQPTKKSWKERYFGLTGEQQGQAGFGEVIRLLKLARKDAKLFACAVVLLIISAAIIMSLPKITGAVLDATKHYESLATLELYGFSLNQFLGIMAGLLLISTGATFGQ
ncbi:unnamed protein product [Ambrosiozyma monospora]|uniref:Unnamed protein product n=1 Tax=Ambrosiozyma monospora TaxID=43982 RepID=A0ACB5TJK5_AMBMO|nr:unnamed protein product [Ambrosiozyma monospora]